MTQKDLTFEDYKKKIKDELGKTEWVTVFSISFAHADIDKGGYFSAFVPNDKVKEVLRNYQGEIRAGGGFHSFCSSFKDGKEIVKYHRFSENGIDPIVYWRSFYGVRKDYYDISEEFRFYFNLFEDRKGLNSSNFIYINDNDGEEDEVVQIRENEVKIKLKYLKEFLAVKEMHLAIYFDFMRFSKKSLNELHQEEIDDVINGSNYTFSVLVRDLDSIDNSKSQGWIMGKKLISGSKDSKPDAWRREKENKYEKFIIGTDEEGKDVWHCCNVDYTTYPGFLRPVFFKREVLKKYYDNPKKYSVEDGRVRRNGFGSLRISNNHSEFVMVLLGDLKSLPSDEQSHWKTFNVTPKKISKTDYERYFEGQFTNPEHPELYFKFKFANFQKDWQEKFGWYLFKPLSKGDFHHFKSLHVPTTEDRKEFDEQVLSLTKIFIDSLNEKELSKEVSIDKKSPKGLDKLEAFLIFHEASFKKEMFEFLRSLQSLRSTSVAHRKSEKGGAYKKVFAFFKFDEKELSKIFEDILIKVIWVLNSLEKHFLK